MPWQRQRAGQVFPAFGAGRYNCPASSKPSAFREIRFMADLL
jgi:hypothetical protein